MVHKKNVAFQHPRKPSKKIPKSAQETDPLLSKPPTQVYSSNIVRSLTANYSPALSNPSPTPSLMIEAPPEYYYATNTNKSTPVFPDTPAAHRPNKQAASSPPKVTTPPPPPPSPHPSSTTIPSPSPSNLSLPPTWAWHLIALCAGQRHAKSKSAAKHTPSASPSKTSASASTYRSASTFAPHTATLSPRHTRDSRFAPSPEPEEPPSPPKQVKDYPVFVEQQPVPAAPMHRLFGYARVAEDVFVPEVVIRGGFGFPRGKGALEGEENNKKKEDEE